MRSRVLSLLVSAALVLHALLGCCAHHSHAAHSPQRDQESPTMSRSCGCHHGHAAPAAEEESGSPEHHPDEPCHEPDCQFVCVARCDDVRQVLSLPLWLPLNDTLDLGAGHPPLSTLTDGHGAPGHLLPADPVRAVTQVWLL